ncbi:unnamed protein product, partial [Candidula unifasciata]
EEETRSVAKSPLIPTLRDKKVKEDVPLGKANLLTSTAADEVSPAPASESCSTDDCSKQDNIRDTNTEDILTQLARMRAYLLNEQKRLQALLETEDM